MSDQRGALSSEERAVVEEEESLLARAGTLLREAVAQAAQRDSEGDLRSLESLRALRDEAASTSDDDLPALLHEMGIRQRLMERRASDLLPDPSSPYLGHLRVREGGKTKDYLLGRASFIEPAADIRIVDWRVAPVAQIFYRYREGDEYEETFPGRVAEGIVEARRVVVIANGVLVQVVADGFVLGRGADGAWAALDRGAFALSPGGGGTAARPGVLGIGADLLESTKRVDVTALLDAEQYAAVCAPPDQPLLVLGTAGSGKTTVALHRLARLAAQDPSGFPLARIQVVVPEEGLARLSRRLLGPLGVGSTQVQTLDAWSCDLAQQVFGEPMPRLSSECPGVVSSLKRHPALYRALRDRFANLAAGNTTYKRLRRRLVEALTDRSFLERVVSASGGDLRRGAIEQTVRHTMLQIADPFEKHLSTIVVEEMKQAIDGRMVTEDTPDDLAGTLDVEDLPIMLFLRAYKGDFLAPQTAHAVLDEAEDFALFELFAIGKQLSEPRSVTLAGDEAQQTFSSFAGWQASLATLGVGDASTCRLEVSYRCPRPVADFAREILGRLGSDGSARSAREGVPVGVFRFPDESHAHLFLAGAVRDLVDREPSASIAVIAHDAETAHRFHELLNEMPAVRLVLQGDFSFEPGIDVTDVDNTKGLEFDYVVIPDATAEAYPATDEARRRLHVAVTRTSHQLWVVSGGRPSPILPATSSPAPAPAP
jgi:DNA helicase II / ATP-dependent DNA helicase PcrA